MMNRYLVFFFLVLIGGYCTAQTQKFIYKKVPLKLVKTIPTNISVTSFVDATSFLPKGYSKRGNIDYTEYIQAAINKHKNILMPNFPLLINDSGLTLKSNSQIYFRKGSKLVMQASSKEQYSVLNINNGSNITLYNPRIVGDKLNHLGKTGEWGMGIKIMSSNNINIINPNISQCWGDGIYLGILGRVRYNSNINISGGIIDNNRRNGISIISVVGLKISDIVVSNTNGTHPQIGIDFEPNLNYERMEEIKLDNVITYNNALTGIGFEFENYGAETQKSASIMLNNCTDHYSRYHLRYHGVSDAKSKRINKIAGAITVNNLKSYDNQESIIFLDDNFSKMPELIFKKIDVYKNGVSNKSAIEKANLSIQNKRMKSK